MGRKQIYIQIFDVLSATFGIHVELAISHKNAGDDVHLIVCRGDLPACAPNSRHDKLACMLCRSEMDRALALPELQGVTVHEMQLTNDPKEFSIPAFKSIDEVKQFSLNGVNHGLEAASSVITVLKDPRPDLGKERALVEANVKTAVSAYRWLTAFFHNQPVDRFYVMNGRYSSQMPGIRAAQDHGIPLVTFELAHDMFKYVLVNGTYYHDLHEKKRELNALWDRKGPADDKRAIGHRFFRERRYGDDRQFVETRFKKRQKPGRLPEGFDKSARNLVIYNSSEYEFTAVTGYENPVYANQIVGLREILADDRLSKDIQIWLRVHPHLANTHGSQLADIAKVQHPQLRVIGASEDIDTYALMDNAEKVLTFGSTMSVESAYAGIPSILVGREPYEDLGCCYTPSSHDEVIRLINARDLAPLPQEGALKYGYWVIAREYEYRFFNPRMQAVNGRRVGPNVFLSLFTTFWWSRYGHKFRSLFRLSPPTRIVKVSKRPAEVESRTS
jgi:hypothetical protein